MAIVTLLTDSGNSDFYAAAVKARLLSINPALTLVDISHHILPYDIAHAAFVLKSVFRDFPENTVHLIGVDAGAQHAEAYIAAQMESHFFVCPDNGLLGLVSEGTPRKVVALNTENALHTTFAERDILAPAAAKLAGGAAIDSLGPPRESFKKVTDRHVKATKKIIAGHVIRVDHYGNAITNIPKGTFDAVCQGRAYTLQCGTEKFRRMQSRYNQTEPGDCFVLFNSLNLLEIGIYRGNASELLGLRYDSPVSILFDE
jgi:S-adenosylmethionine hydrolase